MTKSRIGWIGTGVMGRWMCQHLMTKGYPATVYNRSKDKAQPLLDQGAAWADTPKQVAEKSDVVFAIVGFPKDVREVFLGTFGFKDTHGMTNSFTVNFDGCGGAASQCLAYPHIHDT